MKRYVFESLVASRFLRKRGGSRFLSFMTAVSVGSVAIGTAALALTFTILDGFEQELRSNITGFAAHIQVGTFRNAVERDDPARLSALRGIANVDRASAFLQNDAIAITRDDIDGVMVKGVVPGQDVSQVRGRMISGAYDLAQRGPIPPIVIGKRLADRLGLRVGSTLVLLGITDISDALMAPKVQCVVRGIYETGMAEYFDDLYVFTSLPAAQRLFGLSGAVNGYDVTVRSLAGVEQTVLRIRAALGYPWDPRSVFTIYRNLFVWIDLQKELIPVVVGSLIVISVFNVIATLLLFVIEKTQDIGILAALGATRGAIRRIFIVEGVLIGVIGAAIGCALALAFALAQKEFAFFRLPQDVYYMTTVPIGLSARVFLLPAGAALALAFLSSLIPAWLASRLTPIESIRFH